MNELNNDEISQNKNLIVELKAFVQRYRYFYKEGELTICLIYNKGKYVPTLCKIELRPLNYPSMEDRDLDYGDVRFVRFRFPIDMMGTYLDSICGQKTIEVPSIGKILLNLRSGCQMDLEMSSRTVHKYSHQNWFPIKNDWPYYLISLQLEEQPVDYLKPLLKKNLPTYPQYSFAITDFFNFADGWQAAQNKSVYIMIPDPRAKIEHLKTAGNTIEISLITGHRSLKDLLIKLFAKSGVTMDSNREFVPQSDHFSLDLGFEPEFVSAYLLERETGEEIDWKEIDLIWGSRTEATDVGTTEDSLLQRIERGEGENVEFKENIDENSSKLNFRKTVTAFSNTHGGLIFVGINNEGVATKDCDLKDEDITNYMLGIEPEPRINISRITVDEKRILVVKVEEGQDKPYNLRDHGIFIRRGKTNSRASRLEIQNFFEKEK